MRIQYGGSMNRQKLPGLMAQDQIDGGPHRRRGAESAGFCNDCGGCQRNGKIIASGRGYFDEKMTALDHYGRFWHQPQRGEQRPSAIQGTPHIGALLEKIPEYASLALSGMDVGLPERSDGQQRGWPHQHRRGARGVSGADPDYQITFWTAISLKMKRFSRRARMQRKTAVSCI
jgi:hypothetical protein